MRAAKGIEGCKIVGAIEPGDERTHGVGGNV